MEAIWNANPDVKVLYCFEDGNCFTTSGLALSHRNDTGKDFTTVNRPVEEVKEEKKSTTKTK